MSCTNDVVLQGLGLSLTCLSDLTSLYQICGELTRLENLVALDLSRNAIDMRRGDVALCLALALQALPLLRRLDLSHNMVGGKLTVVLHEVAPLHYLKLTACSLHQLDWQHLAECEALRNSLEELDVSENPWSRLQTQEAALRLFSGPLPQLRVLEITDCGVDCGAALGSLVSGLCSGAPRLRYLNLAQNFPECSAWLAGHGRGIEALVGLPELRVLKLSFPADLYRQVNQQGLLDLQLKLAFTAELERQVARLNPQLLVVFADFVLP